MKKYITILLMLLFILIPSTNADAKIYINTKHEKIPSTNEDYYYKYWESISGAWTYDPNKDLTKYPTISYEVTYDYENAYKMNKYVNALRKEYGLPELQMKDEIMDAAMQRAAEILLRFDHDTPYGVDAAYDTIYCGTENIAVGEPDAKSVFELFKKSPLHKGNMLRNWGYCAGYGCVTVKGRGEDFRMWVQLFSYGNIYNEPSDPWDPNWESNKTLVDWSSMPSGTRKNCTKTFTSKFDPSLIIPLRDTSGFVNVGGKAAVDVMLYAIPLQPEHVILESLTPDLVSCENGYIKGKKVGTGKVRVKLKACPSMSCDYTVYVQKSKFEEDYETKKNHYTITYNLLNEKEVEVVKIKALKGSSVTIPTTITENGVTLQVVTIGKNAMKNNKKTKTLTIGASVKTINSKAFYNCKKLTKVKIKSPKITKIGSKAFGKCKKSMKVTVPKAKKKAYKKLLKKAGVKTKQIK